MFFGGRVALNFNICGFGEGICGDRGAGYDDFVVGCGIGYICRL